MARSADKPSRSKRRPRPKHRRHDESYKRLFVITAAVLVLIRHFVAKGWDHELDLTNIERLPTEFVVGDLNRRTCDCAWRVRLKDGRSVIFLVEFQSSQKDHMVLRTLEYNAATQWLAHVERNPDGEMPLVLSFVVYTGARPWKAAETLTGLGRRRPLPPAMARKVKGMETVHAYQLLDLRRAVSQGLIPEDGLLGWLAALEDEPWTAFPAVYRSMVEQWAGSEHYQVREAFADWTAERMRAAKVPAEVRQAVKEQITQPTEEAEMQTYPEWAAGHERRGEKRGEKRGQTKMLLRQTSRRFGREAARQLEGLVRSMGAEQLTQVGDAVVDCETADELLAVAGNGSVEIR